MVKGIFKKNNKIFPSIFFSLTFSFLFSFLLFFPILSHAQIFGFTYECPLVNGKAGECKFDDLIKAVINITNTGTALAIGFSVIVIAYAGFRYMNAGGNASERSKASGMLYKVVIGIFIIIIAWALVRLVTTALLKDEIKTFLG